MTNMLERKAVVELFDAWVTIPVISRETRSLKKTLIGSLVGGKIKKTAAGAEIHALKGVNCCIYEGDRVALIGSNGSGKSTFIRLLSGIYEATSGIVSTKCRVFPMIHKNFLTGPDLSGYQAVKGQYLLMHNHLDGFEEFVDEIIDFTDLGDYIHLPIKGYSEGMSARLLFALLTSGCHECLALDEGFGTGDTRFFAKAERRMDKFIKTAGTLVLASHSEELLRKFCSRGLVFSKGRIIFDSSLENALEYYHEHYN